MNREALERLVIDRQVGELSADAGHLLDAYLNLSPPEAESARELESMIQSASAALKAVPRGDLAPMPALDAKRIEQVKGQTLQVPRWTRPAAIAAVVALAFFLGSRVGPRQNFEAGTQFAAIPMAPQSHPEIDVWSVSAYENRSRTSQSENRQTVVWSSPLSRPRIGENL